jgi:hypothetical protein
MQIMYGMKGERHLHGIEGTHEITTIRLTTLRLFDFIGHQSPPAINHPEFYYGFAGVTLTWQVVFLLIARDPARYQVMIIPSVLEKFSYVLANLVLFVNQRMSASQALPSTTDLVLALLFIAAFLKTTTAP